jgi:hypothetical protein
MKVIDPQDHEHSVLRVYGFWVWLIENFSARQKTQI